MTSKTRPERKPLNLDPDGSYRAAQKALGEAVSETAYLTGLDLSTIAAQALIAACIDRVLLPEHAWAFRAMLMRAEEER